MVLRTVLHAARNHGLHSLEACTARALIDGWANALEFKPGTARFLHKETKTYVHVPLVRSEESTKARQQAYNGLMTFLRDHGAYVDESVHEGQFDLCSIHHHHNPAIGYAW